MKKCSRSDLGNRQGSMELRTTTGMHAAVRSSGPVQLTCRAASTAFSTAIGFHMPLSPPKGDWWTAWRIQTALQGHRSYSTSCTAACVSQRSLLSPSSSHRSSRQRPRASCSMLMPPPVSFVPHLVANRPQKGKGLQRLRDSELRASREVPMQHVRCAVDDAVDGHRDLHAFLPPKGAW